MQTFLGITLLSLVFVFMANTSYSQSRRNDIDPGDLPQNVENVLVRYIEILANSNSLDDCADNFIEVAGGSLVNEDGRTLRGSVKPYSLKKDHQNIQFYSLNPVKITRVNVSGPRSSGYGPSAIRGKVYKIWIDKKSGQAGRPAPISIMVPEGGGQPKVVGIGSL